MTREQASQIAREIVTTYDVERRVCGPVARSIAAALLAAVAEEREACARVAEDGSTGGIEDGACENIAVEIRARGGQAVTASST